MYVHVVSYKDISDLATKTDQYNDGEWPQLSSAFH